MLQLHSKVGDERNLPFVVVSRKNFLAKSYFSVYANSLSLGILVFETSFCNNQNKRRILDHRKTVSQLRRVSLSVPVLCNAHKIVDEGMVPLLMTIAQQSITVSMES